MIARLPWAVAVASSLLVALLLMAVPLPPSVSEWRPAWVPMVMLYWCLAIPERVGVLSAWVVGLVVDVMQGAILGQHALALALLAYLTILYHQRIRVFPLFQQSLVAGSIVFIYLGATTAIYNVLGSRHYGLDHLLGAATSAALWPWCYVILRDIRRKVGLTQR